MVTLAAPGGRRAVDRCRLLGTKPYSDSDSGLFRAYLSPAWAETLRCLAGWMEQAGMDVRQDAAGNLIGRYNGARAGLPALLVGSHIDSVPMAGCFDGPLGIMLGIEAVAALAQAGRRLPFAIEVIAFGDEEGSRFPVAMLTSRVVGGAPLPALDQIADKQGVTLPQALERSGLDPALFDAAARDPGELIAYLEAHIEQGPVLEAEGLALAAVDAIAAQLRIELTVTGSAGHAGTTPMGLRRDAVAGAAEMVAAIEHLARADAGHLVATVGLFEVRPGAANVIASEVRLVIDLRSAAKDRRDAAAGQIAALTRDIAGRRSLGLASRVLQDLAGSRSDEALTGLLSQAIASTGQRPRSLTSGAGHDAMNLSALCPTTMLFIRCAGGISHNPAESVDPADAELALQAMMAFIDLLEGQYHA